MKIESETDYENAVARLKEIDAYMTDNEDMSSEMHRERCRLIISIDARDDARKRPDPIDRFCRELEDDNQAGGLER